ncbi:MAG TPA: hypothetical protein PLI97_04965 [Fluviicola sp.]|nr:hypothetical protein [Fluviicola sp.]
MKKVVLFAVVVALTGLTSCKKEWTCECDVMGSKISTKSGTKLSKKDAETWCEKNSSGMCNLK